ncbi:acetate--CoA ligase [Quadrisphaera sp. DSM 44207]|uniref:acetate--CoA ligase n=1 Tax=Quadrisphaera sp. DSM 44207 TaxID=1881057 RepID=UPI000891D22E|nr:acetate--CoA ligase [Quadrisphaera sp. DSM 44207]SDQ06007.1 acetyl-coenzyme A synthetase [Quadrisphaera sp. DSM 44207]
MSTLGSDALTTLLDEQRTFAPPPELAAAANLGPEAHERAAADPEAFWAEQAQRLSWEAPWHTVLDWRPAVPVDDACENGCEDGDLTVPSARWFLGGRLNAAVNCVDRHVAAGHGDRVAVHFEGEPGDRRTITYADLLAEVCRAANALTDLGVRPGDRVVLYMPVIPETLVAILAVARIGAVHSLVFGGFSAEALRFRVADTGAKVVVTTDGQFRRGRAVGVKATVDEAVAGLPDLEHVLVVRRTGDALDAPPPWTPGRDAWWHESVGRADAVHEAAAFDAEHPLFVIYTSGSTGRPKGLLHTTGGYLTHASYAHWAHFDAKPATDVHWCTADLAWVTAHTFAVYGPLTNGVTQVMYEGTPDTPHRGRHFEVIERYGVTTYYTAPTLVRTFMAWGPEVPAGHDLSSVRLLGSVGEPINPEAWVWFREHVGGGRAPVVDTWWQSETGATVVAPLPGSTVLKPGSATRPLPGLDAAVVDGSGREVSPGEGGYLVIRRPWPGMARTVWGDPERYRDSYWRRFAAQGWYTAGDGARYDADRYLWLLGRLDDVVNVSGHRMSTSEVESALVAHPQVAEAGVVGVPDERTGQAIAAFVVPTRREALEADPAERAALEAELRAQVASVIGPVAKPRDVVLVADLPKTRSGKIVRRLLGDLLVGRDVGDTTSLQDEAALSAVEDALRRRPTRSGG